MHATDETVNTPEPFHHRYFAPLVFVAVAIPLFVIVAVSRNFQFSGLVPTPFTDPHPWFAGWVRFDGGWYWTISENGYTYFGPTTQSSVAFFPAYPTLMRLGGAITGSVLWAGIIATFILGCACAQLLYMWCRDRLSPKAARTTVLVLLLYPFSWFLFGAVYSDALYLFAAISAFTLLDKDRPVLAGIMGALGTASRPVGLALIVGLVVRALERRDVLTFTRHDAPDGAGRWARLPRPRLHLRAIQLKDAGILLCVGGIVTYALFLNARFGEPLAFVKVADAPGWNHDTSLDTLLKGPVIRMFRDPAWDLEHIRVAAQGIVTIVALLLVPAVIKRFGWGYGAYASLIVVVPALATPEFIGMGRYLLAAFPCFAAGGAILAERSLAVRVPVFASSAVVQGVFASLFSRWYFIS